MTTRPAGGVLAPGAPLFPTVDEDGRAGPALDGLTSEGRARAGGLRPRRAAVARTVARIARATGAISYDQFARGRPPRRRSSSAASASRRRTSSSSSAVDVGEPEPRTIVAGLALSFQPDELVGKRVIVVANLAPREFGKGLVSHGMLLATGPSEKLTLATVADDAAPGARLK